MSNSTYRNVAEDLTIRVEQEIRVCMKPKPRFVPEKLWWKLASKFIRIEQTKPSFSSSHPDIFHDLEPLEREQTAPETRVLEVLSDNKDAPITYQQLADLIEPLNENDVKNAVKSLRSQGKLQVKEAGNKGNYYEVQDMQGLSDE